MPGKLIREILASSPESQDVEIRGWVRTVRDMKNLVFVEMNDGSCLAGIQCTFDRGEGALHPETEKALDLIGTGAAVVIKGRLVPSPASGQAVEVAAASIRAMSCAVYPHISEGRSWAARFWHGNAVFPARPSAVLQDSLSLSLP